MILRPFLSNQPLALGLLLPVAAVFVVLNSVFHYHTPFEWLDLGLLGKVKAFPAEISTTLSVTIVLANAVFLNFLFNRHDFLERNNYTPSLFYVVFMSFSHSFYYFDALLLVHTCWLLAFRLLFDLENGQSNRAQVFNIGCFVGLGMVLFPPSAGLVIFLWLSVRMMKSLTFTEFLLLVLGTVLIAFNGLMYWWFEGHKIGSNLLRLNTLVKYEQMILIAMGSVMFLLLALSMIGVRVRVQKSSIRFKKINRSMLWMVLGTLGLGVAELIFYQQVEWFSLMFVPLGFLFTFAFIHTFWKQVSTVFFYLTFLLAVIKFFIHAGWFN